MNPSQTVSRRFIPGFGRVHCGYCGGFSGVRNTHSDSEWHYYDCICGAKFRRRK